MMMMVDDEKEVPAKKIFHKVAMMYS